MRFFSFFCFRSHLQIRLFSIKFKWGIVMRQSFWFHRDMN